MTDREDFNAAVREFKIGQVAVLKSGGPQMTISATVLWPEPRFLGIFVGPPPPDYPIPGVHCAWMDESGRLQSHVFMPEMLRAKREES
jgi:uncharacterized protein YodC (DUF2158 family)